MSYKEQSDIPTRLDELGTDWLTAALTESGLLRGAKVSDIELQRIGEGEGFIGVVARLRLGYDGDADKAPRSVIAKLPTDVPENRMMGELMGVYWREIFFYQQLGHKLPIRTPALHYAALTLDPMRTRQYKLVAVMDKLPGFIVDKMMVYAKRAMKETTQRYALVIEDLAPARVGDQVSGGTPEVCAEVLAEVAKMHASHWGSPDIKGYDWLLDPTVNPRIRHRMYLEARGGFLERHAKLLSGGGDAYVRWNDQHGGVLGRRLHTEAPPTVIHGDLRLDNVFFDDARPGDRVILGDWQLVGKGCAAYDVAYFMSGTLDAKASTEVEMELLRDYHAALVSGGVSGYGFDRFLRDYQRGLMSILQLLGTTDAMDLGDERGMELMDLWVERTLARLPSIQLDSLL
jgi:hypothetical protein